MKRLLGSFKTFLTASVALTSVAELMRFERNSISQCTSRKKKKTTCFSYPEEGIKMTYIRSFCLFINFSEVFLLAYKLYDFGCEEK